MNASVQSQCDYCTKAVALRWSKRNNRPVHAIPNTRNEFVACKNYDTELRHLAEPMGYYRVAFWPVKCRNGKWRWLTWIEDHGNGTYTLGNRAH